MFFASSLILLLFLLGSVTSVFLVGFTPVKVMAEGGFDPGTDLDDTTSSYACLPLTVSDVLTMTVDELRTELRIRGVSGVGATKPELQMLLLHAIGMRVPAADETTVLESTTVDLPTVGPEQPPVVVPSVSAPPGVEMAAPDYSLPPPMRSPIQSRSLEQVPPGESVRALELRLELRKLELEDQRGQRQLEAQERQRQFEAHEKDKEREARERESQSQFEAAEKQRQFELSKLELQKLSQTPVPARRDGPAPFQVENAVRLIPKFQDTDIETFLISFEKIAALNKFPEDKYTAILQAHLTGKALKVFTELTTAECQDYKTLKEALLAAYAVVPEVYRKRFRASTKGHGETYSEFAFRLTTQFKRWAESEQAYDDVVKIRELIMMEQFTTHLDPNMRSWLIDQKPTTLSELARLADQYVAIHQADRPNKPPQNSKIGQVFQKSGNYHPQKGQVMHHDAGSKHSEGVGKPNSPNKAKPQNSGFRRPVVCYHCKKPGHVMANCRQRLAQLSANVEEKPVQLVISPPVKSQDSHPFPKTYPEVKGVDPRYQKHCVSAQLISPDKSNRTVKVLRDTGALQSLVSSAVVSDNELTYTGEKRLIRGVTGDVIAVPLVEVMLDSTLCSGTFLCGLVSTLPDGIALLVGNDLCSDDMNADVDLVTTRSMAAAQRALNQSINRSINRSKHGFCANRTGKIYRAE